MKRRDFLNALGKTAGLTSLASFLPWSTALRAEPYTGTFFVTIAAKGGWDVSSFCDPKENSEEQIINNWSTDGGVIQTLSGSPITHAPWARNSGFFQNYADSMLVINGIDLQTHLHNKGERYMWSGRRYAGYPSFTALTAKIYGDHLPLAYVTNGGYHETAGLTSYSVLNDMETIKQLLHNNQVTTEGGERYFYPDELDLVYQYQRARLERVLTDTSLLPKTRRQYEMLYNVRANQASLDALDATLPESLVSPIDQDGLDNNLLPQVQMALAAYQAGLCVSADLILDGFDTHANHDTAHENSLRRLTNGIEYLWQSAEAMGIADNLLLFITSELSRAPYYNEENGKDHWSIGSAIFMQKGATWGNRVIGLTDDTLKPLPINESTFEMDAQGVLLNASHIHHALRTLAGINDHSITNQYPLDGDFIDFFST